MNWFNLGAIKQQKEQKAKPDERESCMDFKKANDLGFTPPEQNIKAVRSYCGDFSMPMYSLTWFMAVPSICKKAQPVAVITDFVDNGCKMTANEDNMPGVIHLDCKENPIVAKTGASAVVFTSTQKQCRVISKIINGK